MPIITHTQTPIDAVGLDSQIIRPISNLPTALVETPIVLPPLTDPGGPILGIRLMYYDELVNGDHGAIYWKSNTIGITVDGINWIPVPAPDDKVFVSIVKIPPQDAFPYYVMESSLGEIYSSPDGRTWTACDMSQPSLSNFQYNFLNLLGYAGNFLWATSWTEVSPGVYYAALYRTSDGGITWTLETEYQKTDPTGFNGIVFGSGMSTQGD